MPRFTKGRFEHIVALGLRSVLGCKWIKYRGSRLKVPYITGYMLSVLETKLYQRFRWTLASFIVADNGSIAATLVFSLYELRFTNNPFYAVMVTLSVTFIPISTIRLKSIVVA